MVADGGGDGGGTACVTGGGRRISSRNWRRVFRTGLLLNLAVRARDATRVVRDDGEVFGKQSRSVGQELANMRDAGRFDEGGGGVLQFVLGQDCFLADANDAKDSVLEECNFSLHGCCCGVQWRCS